jgi:DNA modification methylase
MHYDHGDGFDVDESDINPQLFDFQRAIVAWACAKGRAAIFADCGLGKTPMQLEWARLVCERHGGIVLIVAPLAVAEQTAREGEKFGVPVNVCRTGADVTLGVNITNYEMLQHFQPDTLAGVVLDESSILKSYMGVTKRDLVDRFADVPYRLCCTATPSPNDHMELLNHAEFLGVMRSSEALSVWFINDTSTTGTYRLKKHAEADFWRWCSTWAAALNHPSDIGFPDDGFVLPPLTVDRHIVETDPTAQAGEQLFRAPDLSATGYHKEKRLSADARAAKVAEIVAAAGGQVAVWCETNYEADAVTALLSDAVEVRGSDKSERKVAAALGFASGEIRCLVSKPSIFGFGLNFQGCHEVVFCGLSYSFESYYQAVRRFWRFGQDAPVHVHVVIGDGEVPVLESVLGKEAEHDIMKASMAEAMRTDLNARAGHRFTLDGTVYSDSGDNWQLYRGDSVEVIKEIDDDSVGLSVFSPPFSGLYIYSDNLRDMGNTASDAEFFEHFAYMLPDLYRITMPGRMAAVHCKQLVNYKGRDGAAGLRDFRGDIIRAMQSAGFVYHSEVTIWTDPVHEMQRTKSHGLLYKQLRKDSTYSRQGLPEYLCIFRKWAEEDASPVEHTRDEFPLDQWQEWASPVWMDVRRTDVLNAKIARDDRDEKHICPLQLSVIERAVRLWTNPGDLVFSPFAGIGSEGHEAVRLGRRFVGIELKESYWKTACKNLRDAERSLDEQSLFSGVDA